MQFHYVYTHINVLSVYNLLQRNIIRNKNIWHNKILWGNSENTSSRRKSNDGNSVQEGYIQVVFNE